MDDFYAARSGTIPPLPWSSFPPPFLPGLIVHGPLQAALLCNYALELRGERPTRFRFRGLSPLFDDDIFTLHASPLEDGFKLWTATENGPVAMEAEAFWN